jgi:hypothetical protein
MVSDFRCLTLTYSAFSIGNESATYLAINSKPFKYVPKWRKRKFASMWSRKNKKQGKRHKITDNERQEARQEKKRKGKGKGQETTTRGNDKQDERQETKNTKNKEKKGVVANVKCH